MAALPPLTQLLGNHGPLLEGYWSLLDPSNSGKIEAGTAAAFLKKSQLREPVLHKIWNLSDPDQKGWLDKQGLFMALRLIAVCQAGKEPSVASMALTDPPPKLVGVDVPATNKWTVEAAERTKYEQVFQSLQPSKGLLGGDRAKPFMMTTKLPVDVLGKVWKLSDIDKDGSLDLDEFCVAMKLMALAGSKEVLPAVLPASLIPPSKKSSSPSAAVSATPASLGGTTPIIPPPMGRVSPKPSSSPAHNSPVPSKKVSPYSSTSSLVPVPSAPAVSGDDPEWVVSTELKTKYDGYFQGIDKDHDGFISGEEARSLFMASNLPSSVLAHIWNLCDMEKNGRLNAEQFALAMYLIAEKVRKKDIPQDLTAAMIPPSLRGKVKPPSSSSASSSTAATTTTGWGQMASSIATTNGGALPASWTTPTSGGPPDRLMKAFSTDFSAIQELDSITNEIQAIRKEKAELSEDIKTKQELVQQRKVELEDLQGGVTSATEQREKLERDREEARRLLEQLETEKAKYESQIAELKQNCQDEKEEIEKLKQQLSEQETGKRSQEEELQQLKEQLEQLKKEETEYRHKVELSKAELDKLQKHNQSVQLDITQVRQKIETLKEEHQSLTTALTLYPPTNTTPGSTPSSSVININDVGQLSAELHVPHMSEHDAVSARATVGSSSPVSSLSGFSTNSHLDEGPEEGGSSKEDKARVDPFASTSSAADPFAAFSLPTSVTASDPFGGRAFTGKPSDLSAFDPFGGGSDPFKSSTAAPTTGEDLFKSDPFGAVSSSSSKPPSSLPPTSTVTVTSTAARAVDPFSGQDPFNSDPFSSNDKQATPWDTSAGFDVDPFGQQNVRTPTDPFAGGDPFGDDPFGMKSGGGASNGNTNPFGGGDNIFGGGQGDS